ncbi:hypothetical protein TrRE_jg11763 [Triparma retinervis]|uniref:Uncharacterized protein n=1 Tax=Triparma retinervis TaxID=2557542 RepID=A0A9W7FFL6_9STRA|nr:hypothetical protein TrRE_jg11763 [Triparma retinervis]
MHPGSSDVSDVLGELERKYVNAVEWERVEESYLGAGDGGGGDEEPPPRGVQGDDDGPWETRIRHDEQKGGEKALKMQQRRGQQQGQQQGQQRGQQRGQQQNSPSSSPNAPYDSQLASYDTMVRHYKASVSSSVPPESAGLPNSMASIEGRAAYLDGWRRSEEAKMSEREREIMESQKASRAAQRQTPTERRMRRKPRTYDEGQIKIMLGTFYAYHKPENMGAIKGIVEGWKGDKMEILRTVEVKYGVGEEVWGKIMEGSWVPNTETTYSETVGGSVGYGEGCGEGHGKETPYSVLPAGKIGLAIGAGARAFEDYQIVEDTVFNAPYGAMDRAEIAALVPGEWGGVGGDFDMVVHEVVFSGRGEGRRRNDWTDKLRTKKVRLGYCNVVPVLSNGGIVGEDAVDGVPVEIVEVVEDVKSEVDGQLGQVEGQPNAKLSTWRAEFNLPLQMNVGGENDTSLYGYLVSIREILDDEEVLIGRTYIPKGDLISYCHRNRESVPNNRRTDVVKRCEVDNEILLTNLAISRAEEEKESIADLFERLANGDKLGVGTVIGKYFQEIKRVEKSIMEKSRPLKELQGRAVLSKSRKSGPESVGSRSTATFASNGGGQGRRKSKHFADGSILPRQYAEEALDLRRLTLLCHSVFDNPGGVGNYTSVVNRSDTGIRHGGKVSSSGMRSKEELMKTGLDGRRSERSQKLEETTHTEGTPGYAKQTIQARERGLQKEYEPNFDLDTRGRDEARRKFVADLKVKERLKGTGSGGGREMLEKERADKGGWKGFRRSSMEGGVNAEGGGEWGDVFKGGGRGRRGTLEAFKGVADAAKR